MGLEIGYPYACAYSLDVPLCREILLLGIASQVAKDLLSLNTKIFNDF